MREYYWPAMANGFYKTVKYCCEYARSELAKIVDRTRNCALRVAKWIFVTMDILGSFRKGLNRNHFILVVMDSQLRLKSTKYAQMTNWHVAPLYLDSWLVPYHIETQVITPNIPQFIGEVFELLCHFSSTKHLKTTSTIQKQVEGQNELI